jgi:hypothetical protein
VSEAKRGEKLPKCPFSSWTLFDFSLPPTPIVRKQAECQTRFGGREGYRRKVKFEIRRELGAKPETSEEAKTSKYAPRLTEWLVSTLLLVSVEEYSDGSQAARLHPEDGCDRC